MDPSKAKGAMKIEKNGLNIGVMEIAGEVGFDWYGDAWDAGYFKAQLKDLGAVDRIEVYINSPGGSVMDGLAITNSLIQHPAAVHVYIDGIAASIASVIAMAADPGHLYMPSNTLMFVHEPWTYTQGNADDLRADAAALDKMSEAIVASYARHMTGDAAAAMAANTWYTAAECATAFGANILDGLEAVATLDLSRLGDIPVEARAFLAETAESAPDGEADEPAEEPAPEGEETEETGTAEDSSDSAAAGDDPPAEEEESEEEAEAPEEEAEKEAAPDGEAQAHLRLRAEIATEVKADLLLSFQARETESAEKLGKVQALVSKLQSEKDKAQASYDRVHAQNQTLSAKLDKLTRGAMNFHSGETTWTEALAKHGGDYASARKAHPDLYNAWMKHKRG